MAYDVSVIIPVYNREKYIERCLDSVVNQTYDNYEVVIVDDGSTDNTKNIIDRYTQKYNNIRYIFKENGGVSSARNLGIKESKGEYIAFLDSDDQWSKDFINKQIIQLKNKDCNVCYCGMKVFNIEQKSNHNKIVRFRNDVVYEVLRGYMEFQPIIWMIERKIITDNNILFDCEINYGEDLLFFLKVTTIGKIACVHEYLSYYNMHNDSLTNNINEQLSIIDVFNQYKIWLEFQRDIKDYDKQLIYRLIDNYKIPACILRTFYDSVNIYGRKFIEKNKKYYKLIKNLDASIGANKFTLILYKFAIKNMLFYKIISYGRKIKNILKDIHNN